jgi:hypothetical protein
MAFTTSGQNRFFCLPSQSRIPSISPRSNAMSSKAVTAASTHPGSAASGCSPYLRYTCK